MWPSQGKLFTPYKKGYELVRKRMRTKIAKYQMETIEEYFHAVLYQLTVFYEKGICPLKDFELSYVNQHEVSFSVPYVCAFPHGRSRDCQMIVPEPLN